MVGGVYGFWKGMGISMEKKSYKLWCVLYYLCWIIYPLLLLSSYFLLPMMMDESIGVVYHVDLFYALDLHRFINRNFLDKTFTHVALILLIYGGIAISVLLLILWFLEVRRAVRGKTFQVVSSKYNRIRGRLVWGYFICTNLTCCLLRQLFEGFHDRGNLIAGVSYWRYQMGSWYAVGMHLAIILVAWHLFLYPGEDSGGNIKIGRILLGVGALIYLAKNILFGYIGLLPIYHSDRGYTILTYLDNICFFAALLTFWFRPFTDRGKKEGILAGLKEQWGLLASLLICILILCFVPLYFEYYHYGMIVCAVMGIYFISRSFSGWVENKKENPGKKGIWMVLLGIILLGIECFVYANMCEDLGVWVYKGLFFDPDHLHGVQRVAFLSLQWLFPCFEWIFAWRTF